MEIIFVEDRLPALFNVMNNKKLSSVKLYFALWGYNTRQDKVEAKIESIKSININGFLADNLIRPDLRQLAYLNINNHRCQPWRATLLRAGSPQKA